MNEEKAKEALFTSIVVVAMIPWILHALIAVQTMEEGMLVLTGVVLGFCVCQIADFCFEYLV